jgi:hypothetical protein
MCAASIPRGPWSQVILTCSECAVEQKLAGPIDARTFPSASSAVAQGSRKRSFPESEPPLEDIPSPRAPRFEWWTTFSGGGQPSAGDPERRIPGNPTRWEMQATACDQRSRREQSTLRSKRRNLERRNLEI